MQRKEEEKRKLLLTEHEAYNLTLKDTEEALAGRSWLVLMNLMTAVFHAYVKRNGLHSDSDVELYDMLELIDKIIANLEEQLSDEKDGEGYSKKEEIIEVEIDLAIIKNCVNLQK